MRFGAGDWQFINDFRTTHENDPGHYYRVCLLDFVITECPGAPLCYGRHWHVILSVLNLGFMFTVAWLPKDFDMDKWKGGRNLAYDHE